MAWTAIIDKVIQDPDATVVEVTYTDGQKKIQKEYRLNSVTLDGLKRIVQDQINQFASTATETVKIPLGPFDTTIVPPDPTPRDLFLKDLILLGHYQRCVAFGVMKSDDPTLLAQIDTVKQGLADNPTFIDLF